MSNEVQSLLKRRRELMDELTEKSFLLRGTWVENYSTCSRPNCKCHQGKKHGPRHYLAVVENKKQKMYYVRKSREDLVKRGIENSEHVQKILLEITNINMELLREGYYDEKNSG